ncbi:MAG TPA: hypothetical protein PLQ88_13120, partial [Blastocatellia bacterium]|nr:hypothetical protein [Blastocatellia bacterium]
DIGEVRRSLAGEVKLRQAVIKPLNQALRTLTDPHKNAVALHKATPPAEMSLPNACGKSHFLFRLRDLAWANGYVASRTELSPKKCQYDSTTNCRRKTPRNWPTLAARCVHQPRQPLRQISD